MKGIEKFERLALASIIVGGIIASVYVIVGSLMGLANNPIWGFRW